MNMKHMHRASGMHLFISTFASVSKCHVELYAWMSLISVVKCLPKSDVNNADSKRDWSAIGDESTTNDFNAAHSSS